MYFKQVFDEKLAQYSYLIGCQATGEAIVIDPLRDIDQYLQMAEKEELEVKAAADTHIHADYVTGLREFAEQGIKIYASDEGNADWKYEWVKNDGYNSRLLHHEDTFNAGNILFKVIHTPGHTPESISFLVTDTAATDQPMGILTGDFVFVGDVGRPDLLETAAGQAGAMESGARALFQSVEKFKELPDYLQIWPAHGAGSACGKALGAVPASTVGYESQFSPAFKASGSKEDFISFVLDGQPEPPLYFGRMKIVNKEGPGVLSSLPTPSLLSIEQILKTDGIIVDTREKHTYMRGHLSGALLATFDNNFNTIAGSYIDAERDIYLLIDEENLEQAVRDLIRVGLDHIKGYVTPKMLENFTGSLEHIEAIDFAKVADGYEKDDFQVLDVRKATEFAEAHIPGAINIAHTRLAAHLDELPRDKRLLVHCASGRRASYASGLLANKGFDLQWVDDSFDRWKQEDAAKKLLQEGSEN